VKPKELHRRDAESTEGKIEIQVESLVSIRRESDGVPVDVTSLRKDVVCAIAASRQAAQRLDVLIVPDDRMRELHKRYKGEDSTTDVLTFPMQNPGAGIGIEADIVVCADEAARQAKELGHSVERELLLYIVHGLLHCCGFDDHTEADAAKMHAEEDRILEAIGVGATYKPKES